MNIDGHSSVFEEAGRPLLVAALGNDDKSIDAVHLGNWLTDLSQLIDPVTFAGARTKVTGATEAIKRLCGEVVDMVKGTAFRLVGETGAQLADKLAQSMAKEIASYAEEAKQELLRALDVLTEPGEGERDTRLGKFVHQAVLVVAYFKFVHPHRMSFEGFCKAFGPRNGQPDSMGSSLEDWPGAFTQYYPHEHVDRPALDPNAEEPQYAPRQMPGQRSGKRCKAAAGRTLTPDLYGYLREDIVMTAGLLAEVDTEFARMFATKGQRNTPAWHVTMAKLGHALHQVEDFFAHSNWIELASREMGAAFVDKLVPKKVSTKDDDFLLDHQRTVYHKRLREVPRQGTEDKTWLFTGFYDPKDTWISLSHVALSVFGIEYTDPTGLEHSARQVVEEAVESPEKVLKKFQECLVQSLQTVSDPKAAFADPDNTVAQSLKRKWEPTIEKLGAPFEWPTEVWRQMKVIFPQAAEAAKHDFIGKAILFLFTEQQRAMAAGKIGISVFTAMLEVAKFWASPAAWLKDKLGEKAVELAKEVGFFAGITLLEEKLGAGREGCHSLLAKDDPHSFLYELNRQCACAVHFTIVKQLLRWQSDKQATPIDWLELLEFFLAHPIHDGKGRASYVLSRYTGTVVHVVKKGEQLDTDDPRWSLAKRYAKTSVKRYSKDADKNTFNWRTIADANFATGGLTDKQARDVINQTLEQKGWGEPVARGNYAFKEGVRLIIPQQKLFRKMSAGGRDFSNVWWAKIFAADGDWASLFRTANPPYEPCQPRPISKNAATAMQTGAKKLRKSKRHAYRPRTH